MCLCTKHLATLLFILEEIKPKKTLNNLQGNQNTFGPNQSEMLIFPLWTTATTKYLLFMIMQASQAKFLLWDLWACLHLEHVKSSSNRDKSRLRNNLVVRYGKLEK